MGYSNLEMQQMMRQEIPLCNAMELTVEQLSDCKIAISAPLTANRNNHGSFFAGSLYSLAAITGWGLLTHYAHSNFVGSGVVVRKGDIEYFHPVIESRLEFHCQLPDQQTMTAFVERLNDKGMARIGLTVELKSGDQLAVRFRGTYTVLTAEQISLVEGKNK